MPIWVIPNSLPRALMSDTGPGWPGFGPLRPRHRLSSSAPSLGLTRGPMAHAPPALGAPSVRRATIGSGTHGPRPSWRLPSAATTHTARRMRPWACWPSLARLARPRAPLRLRRVRPPTLLVGEVWNRDGSLWRRAPPRRAAVADGFWLPLTREGPLPVTPSPGAATTPLWGSMRWPPVPDARPTRSLPWQLARNRFLTSLGSFSVDIGWMA